MVTGARLIPKLLKILAKMNAYIAVVTVEDISVERALKPMPLPRSARKT